VEVFKNKNELKAHLKALMPQDKTIGFVPTMGALHKGHLSLVSRALNENDIVVVSIFVNPTQFNNLKDLDNYPRTLQKDLKLLSDLKDDIIIYAPSVDDLYGENVTSGMFDFDGLEHEMEGAFRAGHFDGVGTIVKRLFKIVEPQNAYFGEKDFQQLQIIRKLVEKEGFNVNIVGCPILRESDGLAMSSRNQRLSAKHRQQASFIFQILKSAKAKFGTENAINIVEWVKEQFKTKELLDLEYFIIADEQSLKPIVRKKTNQTYRAFIAVYAGDIRLIDNIALN